MVDGCCGRRMSNTTSILSVAPLIFQPIDDKWLLLFLSVSAASLISQPISGSSFISTYQGIFLILGGSFTPAYQWLFLYLSTDSSVQLLSGSSPIWAYQPLSGSSIIDISRFLPYLGWLLYPGLSVTLPLS